MNVIAVITDPQQVCKILLHLVKTGRRRPADLLRGGIQTSRNRQSVSLPAPGEEHVPATSPVLLTRAHFSSSHKVPERNHSGAQWYLVPRAEAMWCNVPDHREN